MSGKEIIGDLYNIFPSANRQKRWADDALDVTEKTVAYVQKTTAYLLKNEHFLNAVDENEVVSLVLSSLILWSRSFIKICSRTALARSLTAIPQFQRLFCSSCLESERQLPLRNCRPSHPTSRRLLILYRSRP